MKKGRTIVAEREKAESDSERMQARKEQRKKQKKSTLIGVLILVVMGLIIYLIGSQLVKETNEPITEVPTYEIRAEVIDEDNQEKISARTQAYISVLEADLADLGYKVVKVVLPTGMSRTLYVDLDGQKWYYKVDIDRGTAETAEDIARMTKYLSEKKLTPGYVDVRVPGKAVFK